MPWAQCKPHHLGQKPCILPYLHATALLSSSPFLSFRDTPFCAKYPVSRKGKRGLGLHSARDTPFLRKNLVSREITQRKLQRRRRDTLFQARNHVSRNRKGGRGPHSACDTPFLRKNLVSRIELHTSVEQRRDNGKTTEDTP